MPPDPAHPSSRVRIVPRSALPETWRVAFADLAKDARYYEIVEETLRGQFEWHYAILGDAVQPFFFVEQDLVATAPRFLRALIQRLRGIFPRLLRLRMLMAGCAAGEGRPASLDPEVVQALAAGLMRAGRERGAALVIWKDMPARHREALRPLTAAGFLRIASMPATRLRLAFAGFEDYLQRHLSHASRKDLRRKFRASASAAPIVMSVASEVGGIVEEVHALYAQVLARSPLQFERLTPEFFAEVGRRMPDRARFFLWRQEGRLIAFSLCFVHDDAIYDEYLGLDYLVAHELHLYFVTLRDVLAWAMAQGLKTYYSTPLNYDPKQRLGFELALLDLYVRATRPCFQPLLRLALPFLQPTRAEPALRRFSNAHEL